MNPLNFAADEIWLPRSVSATLDALFPFGRREYDGGNREAARVARCDRSTISRHLKIAEAQGVLRSIHQYDVVGGLAVRLPTKWQLIASYQKMGYPNLRHCAEKALEMARRGRAALKARLAALKAAKPVVRHTRLRPDGRWEYQPFEVQKGPQSGGSLSRSQSPPGY